MTEDDVTDDGGVEQKLEFVVRSEIDGGAPGIRYDDVDDAREKKASLNEERGLPDDHEVVVEKVSADV